MIEDWNWCGSAVTKRSFVVPLSVQTAWMPNKGISSYRKKNEALFLHNVNGTPTELYVQSQAALMLNVKGY